MPKTGSVSLTIYDVSGRTVRINNYNSLEPGVHTLNWNCIDNNQHQVSSGCYFYHVRTEENSYIGKLIVSK